MFQKHSAVNIVNHASDVLDFICPTRRDKLIGIKSADANVTTSRLGVVVTKLGNKNVLIVRNGSIIPQMDLVAKACLNAMHARRS